MDKFKVYFRADGNAQIGIGHVVRSLALAEMLSVEFNCSFIIRQPIPTLKDQILSVCQEIIELPTFVTQEKEAIFIAENYLSNKTIIVIDGYNFREVYQKTLITTNCKLVCIDDIHAHHFFSDIIINHSGIAQPSQYTSESYTQYCFGLKYALLRKPFRLSHNSEIDSQRAKNLFICFGGADPQNHTLTILKKCEQLKGIEHYYVILGGAYAHRKELDAYLKETNLNIELLFNLSAEEMAFYMKKCALAITPPSTISYEYLSIGGILYLQSIADNQKDIHNFLIKSGLAFDLQDLPQKDEVKIKKAIIQQKELFGGHQEKRFVSLFKALVLTTRKAMLEDLLLYFEWTNDPATRLQSFNPQPIPLENHTKWFKNRLNDPNSILYIVSYQKQTIGQIRFEISNKEAIISYSVDKNYRGLGFGKGLLRKGINQYLKEHSDGFTVIGFVKKDNIPSIKAFRALGFKEEETNVYNNSFKYTLA